MIRFAILFAMLSMLFDGRSVELKHKPQQIQRERSYPNTIR